MSLQVWLPLNGNLHNQGLDGKIINTSNSGAVINNNGKIGKCYSFDGVDDWIQWSINKEDYGNKPISFCCWFKSDLTKASGTILDLAADLTLGYSYSSNTIKFNYWRVYGTSSARSGDSNTISNSFNANTWHHITAVFDDTTNKIYVDGILQDTWQSKSQKFWEPLLGASYNKFSIGKSAGSNIWVGGLINDVRIYNHALSDKEIEEIAKGLILHYKLDDSYAETTTMLSSSITTTAYNSSLGKYGYNTDSNLGKVDGLFQGKQCTKVYTLTAGQTAQPYAYFGNLFTSDGTNQPAYKTLSFDYYTTVPTTTWLNIYKLGSGTGTATWKTSNSDGIKTGTYTNSSNSISVKPNEWNHIEVIFHGTTAANAEWGYCINGPAHTTNENYYFLYANIQLEENDHATGYGESMHSNIIYDSSGYNNNGEIIGSLETIAITTQRYSYTTKFDGNTACIKIPYNDINPDRIFTVNLWFYKDALGSKNYETLFGGPSGFEMDTRAGSASTLSLYMASTRGGNVYTPLNLNEWTMITMVRDGVNELYYVNGDLKKTIEAKGMPNGQYRIGAWASDTGQNYYGYISDFRIYATALTAKQILELYHTSATIDNKGNIYAREVIE